MLPDKKDKHNKSESNEKKSDGLVVSRRTFLSVSALTASAFTVKQVLKRPEVGSGLLPLELNEDEGVITENWVNTSCLNCPTRCATEVRVVNGKAVRIAGNPLSKVSEGENCPRSHVGLQVLYDPDRVKGPLKRTNPEKGQSVDPRWVSIPWEQALTEVANNLKTIREKGQPQKLLLFRGLNSISNEDLIKRLAESYGTPNLISHGSLEDEASKAGEWMADGNYTHSAYNLENTNYILAFGASIVESQRPLARNLRMWGKIRQERPNRAKVVVIDPRYSVTAAKADRWIPITPGTDAALALGLANVMITERLYDFDFINKWTTGFDDFEKLVLSEYSPEKVAEITGVSADIIITVAREFARFKPSIAWRGRGATCWPNGSYAGYAIFCLNALAGSIDVPGGVTYQEYPEYKEMPEINLDSIAKSGIAGEYLDLRGGKQFPAADVVSNQVADSILQDRPYPVDMAVGFGSNINMSAPGTARWNDAMAKIPYYVHIAPAITEMAMYADIILPSSTFLEGWAYDHCPPGSGFTEVKIKQPAVKPVHDTKSVGDIIFELAGRIGGTVASSFTGIGDSSEGFVKYRTGNLINWDEFVEKGVYVKTAYRYRKYDSIFNTPSKKFEFNSGNLKNTLETVGENAGGEVCLPQYKAAEFMGDQKDYPLMLITYHPLLNVENGNQNYPWAQEIFLVMHGYGWTNFAEINSSTARDMNIKDGDEVWVESPFNKLKVKARVFEGIRPGVVAIASGEGHTECGRWARGIGVNPNDIIGVDYDDISGQSAYFNTRVKVYKA